MCQLLLLKEQGMLFSSCTEKYAFFGIAQHPGVRGFKRKHLKFTLPPPLWL